MEIRNIAIIAHVDHGKTTLVDRILEKVKLFRDNQLVDELILDSNDLERERGITILSKNVSVRYKDTKINIIDTPGHADFGGEVERIMNMADGVLLLVDAFEGPMPQTRFVLQKALEKSLKPMVVINKVDKPNCTPEEVYEKVFDLMFSLDATEEQLDFPVVYGSSKMGWMGEDWKLPTTDFTYLLDSILEHIPPVKSNPGSFQMQISSLDYSAYTGRIAIGKINRGTLKINDQVVVMKENGRLIKAPVKELYTFEGLERAKCDSQQENGEIVAIVGLEEFEIGDTVCSVDDPEAMDRLDIDEPTMSMLFTINDSPFFGKDGKYVTSRHLRERLIKETERNLSLKVEDGDSRDKFYVYGRGILHLSILVETMRREGYELQLGQPRVVTKMIDGQKNEPLENLTVNTPENFSGKVIELVSARKGEIVNIEKRADRLNMEFKITSRALIGLSNYVLTATEGQAIMSHQFSEFTPWKGNLDTKRNGALIAMETGTAISYSIFKLQDRGKFFVNHNDEIYVGQVVGESTRSDDMTVNLTKTKKLTNVRASGSDEKISITPPILFSLEQAMEYISDDEYVEVTPSKIRLRKIILDENQRKKFSKKATA